MSKFGGVLLLAFIGFGNTFYILALNVGYDGLEKGSDPELFTGNNFLMALIYSYKTGLGDFSTDDYKGDSAWLIWLVFLLSTILIQIILLNLLIAIMGDTFDKVMELGE